MTRTALGEPTKEEPRDIPAYIQAGVGTTFPTN
jgi:hypothetical protein